ncbi:MAG: CHC2 zinc finger domain-containing protein [Myxococcota bacterium]
MSCFHREMLPPPLEYYARQGYVFQGNAEWQSVRCPFHDDGQPSLRLNLETGGFFCHGCGAKGGDVLDFHRKLFSLSFVAAAKALGAWR